MTRTGHFPFLKNTDKHNHSTSQPLFNEDTIQLQKPFSSLKTKKELNLDTESYNIESFYDYWLNNSTKIEPDLQHQFHVIE